MRILVTTFITLIVARSAHAEPAWRLGAAGVSRFDGAGDGGVGFALQAMRLRGDNAFGLVLEHTWLLNPADADELDVRQLDALAVARLGTPFALELAGGLAVYHGRVDIPKREGCFGCGAYGGSSVAPVVRLGVVWSQALGRGVTLEVGARVVGTRAVLTKTDVHNFDPQPFTLQSSIGFSRAL
ncbi:MAG: hypothetical protein WKG01_13885 [Kofleriaceae bacterium]